MSASSDGTQVPAPDQREADPANPGTSSERSARWGSKHLRHIALAGLATVSAALWFGPIGRDQGLFELAGRSAKTIAEKELPANAVSLVVTHVVFVLAFAAALALCVGRCRVWRPLAYVAIGAYLLVGEVENRQLLEIVHAKRDGELRAPREAARQLASASAAKWALLCAALLLLAASWYVALPKRRIKTVGWGRTRSSSRVPVGPAFARTDVSWHGPANRSRLDNGELISEWTPNPNRFGVALSGGGIRSASFALGAMQELRARGLLEKARYLTTVSGGGYTGSAFTAMNQPRVDPTGTLHAPEAERQQWREGAPEEQALRRSLRYLATSNAGLISAVGRIVFGLFVNLVLLYLLTFAFVRPVGWLIGSDWVAPGLRVQQPVATRVFDPTDKRCTVSPPSDTPPISIVDVRDASPSVSTRRFEVTLAAPTQCIALVSPPSIYEKVKSIRLEMFRPAIVIVAEGVARVERQGSFAPRWCTPKDCPNAQPGAAAGDVVAGLIDVVQPTISLRPDAVGIGPSESIAPYLTVDRPGPRRMVTPVSILDRRDPDKAQRSVSPWVARLLLLAAAVAVYRIGRRPNNYRTFNRIALWLAVGGATLLVVWTVLPAAVDAVPRAISAAANGGASPATRPKVFGVQLPASSLSNIIAFVVLGARSVQRHLSRGKGQGAAAIAKPLQSNGRALAKKVSRVMSRTVIGVVLFFVAFVNILTILTVGALNGPNGRFTWLSDLLWGDRFVGKFPPDYLLWLVVVFILLALVSFTEASSWSMAPIYRRRLTNGFAWSRRGDTAERRPYGRADVVGERAATRTDEGGDLVARSLAWQDLTSATTGGYAGGVDGDGTEHVLCCAANVRGEDRAPTARNAISFSASRSYVGAAEIGWMDTKTYRSKLSPRRSWDVSLPGLVATSGAAASPGMGRADLGPTGSVLAILNVRLGAWLPNPAWVAQVEDGEWRHVPGWRWFVREVFRRFDSHAPYLYVTDGGHWENLGLVELLRRGCANVVVVSAAGDGLYSNSTFASAVEIARTDLGVEIEIDALWKTRPFLGEPTGRFPEGREYLLAAGSDAPVIGRFASEGWAFGSIRYPCDKDGDAVVGTILLIEASMVDGLAADVHAYAEKHPEFPNVSTGDQFFTDEDFEAYRVLGRTLVRDAFSGSKGLRFSDTIDSCSRAHPAH